MSPRHGGSASAEVVEIGKSATWDSDFPAQLEELNTKWALIWDGNSVRIGSKHTEPVMNRSVWRLLTQSEFLLVEKNPAARVWLKHPTRKTFEKGFIFDLAVTSHPGAINLWTGFAVQPKRGDWGLIREHIERVLVDGDSKAADYTIKWCESAWNKDPVFGVIGGPIGTPGAEGSDWLP